MLGFIWLVIGALIGSVITFYSIKNILLEEAKKFDRKYRVIERK